jgi:hypothetical protein
MEVHINHLYNIRRKLHILDIKLIQVKFLP